MIKKTKIIVGFALLSGAFAGISLFGAEGASSNSNEIGKPHAYFDSLAKRSEVLASYSLRNNEQLSKYACSQVQPKNVTYLPAEDKDPRKQDAAKIIIPYQKGNSLRNQVRLPIPEAEGKSILVTWDAWFGKEFMFNNSNIGCYKNFQFGSGKIWTEVRSCFKLGYETQKPPAISMVDVRQYGQPGSWPDGEKLGPIEFNGINYGNSSLGPMKGEFAVQPETWTRYWVLFNPVGGDWFEFSLWVADEKKEAVQLLDKIKIRPNTEKGFKGWDKLWLEYNTSTNVTPESRGTLVSYARNVVMLTNVSDVTSLLQRPVGEGHKIAAK